MPNITAWIVGAQSEKNSTVQLIDSEASLGVKLLNSTQHEKDLSSQ